MIGIPRLRMHELLRRLGAQDNMRQQVPLADVVSQCAIVTDIRELVPPILSARAHFGGVPVVGGAAFAAVQVIAGGGGCWVNGSASVIGGTLIRWRIQAASTVLTASANSPAQNFGDSPCLTTCGAGEQVAPILGVTFPAAVLAPNIEFELPLVFLPPGFALYIESTTAGVAVAWNFNVQEFVASRA